MVVEKSLDSNLGASDSSQSPVSVYKPPNICEHQIIHVTGFWRLVKFDKHMMCYYQLSFQYPWSPMEWKKAILKTRKGKNINLYYTKWLYLFYISLWKIKLGRIHQKMIFFYVCLTSKNDFTFSSSFNSLLVNASATLIPPTGLFTFLWFETVFSTFSVNVLMEVPKQPIENRKRFYKMVSIFSSKITSWATLKVSMFCF